MQSSPASVSEVHDALTKRIKLEISRKTVQRDLLEMQERGIVSANGEIPQRFKLAKPFEIQLVLTVDEAEFLLSVIPLHISLYKKIKDATEAN